MCKLEAAGKCGKLNLLAWAFVQVMDARLRTGRAWATEKHITDKMLFVCYVPLCSEKFYSPSLWLAASALRFSSRRTALRESLILLPSRPMHFTRICCP